MGSIAARARTADRTNDARTEAVFIAVLTVTLILWASAFVGIRIAVVHFTPGGLALLRFVLAATLLGGYVAASGKGRAIRRASAKDWLAFAALGLTGVVVYHIALNEGERTVSAGAASLLVNTTPLFTVVLAALFLGDRLGRRGWVGLIIAFSGAALVSLGTEEGFALSRGVLWILVAAIAQAIYFIVQKDMLERYGALELTSASLACGAVMLLPFAPELWGTLRTAPATTTAVALYLGIGPSALAYVSWAYIVTKIPVSKAVSFLYLVPVIAFAMEFIALGETPGVLSVVGGVATILGVAIVHRRGA